MKKGFAVIFYRPDEFLTTEKNGDVARNGVRNGARNKTEQAVLVAVSNNPELTADEIAKAISKSSRPVQRYLESLQKKNLIRRVGSTKAGAWEVIDNAALVDEQ